jgi:hypothetical protein
MQDLTQLGPSAAPRTPRAIFDSVIHEDAVEEGEEVRCVRPGVDPLAATNPMPWTPVSRPAGWFYPKRGDRAVLAYPADGPEVIVAWFPSADAAPDVPA